MGSKNHEGQILIEVCVVMLLIVLVGFAGITQLSQLKHSHKKYQLTEDRSHATKNSAPLKK